MGVLEIVSDARPVGNRKQWLRLAPDLIEALEELAEQEGQSVEGLVTCLLNEGLLFRLRRR